MSTTKTEKKTVTVKFTAAEAKWLVSKLQAIKDVCTAKIKDGNASYSLHAENFRAESLVDRIESEQ